MASPDLVIKFGDILETPTIFPDEQGKVQVIVTNQGDRTVTQPFDISLYASTDSELDDNPLNKQESGIIQDLEGTDELLGTLRLNNDFNPGQSRTFTIDFAGNEFKTPSVVSPGAYFLIAEVDSGDTIGEGSKEGNNIADQFISTDGADAVLVWNSTLLNAIQAEGERLRGTNINEVLPIASPPFAARNAAIVHRAIYDAVVEASRTDASLEAAVVGAAYRTLRGLYPRQRAAFDEQKERSLKEILNGEAKDTGFALGVDAANQILAERRNDGSAEAQFPISNGDEPGEWRPTPTRGETTPKRGDALLPGWGEVDPFDASSVEELLDILPNSEIDDILLERVLDGPPELGSRRYARSVNRVKALGRDDESATRNEDQTEIAQFWSYDRPDTFGPPGQWQEIAQEVALAEDLSLAQNARLFARLTTAMANAGIVTWDLKYEFDQWRPITAIQEEVEGDGVISDPTWEPLLDTPPFPDYVSGHAAFGAAAARVLAGTFGNRTRFDIPSQELPDVSRYYRSFSGAARENALSRIYGGVHVGPASVDGVITGLVVGQTVGDFTVENFDAAV